MSRRDFSKGANRSYSSAPQRDADESAFRQATGPTSGAWYLVYKNGVKLSYGKSREAAELHASRCGGEVRVSKGKPK
jgi:hypothetical protein